MKYLAFAASHRPMSLNRKLVLCAAKNMRDLGTEVDFVEYGGLDMPLYNDSLDELPKSAGKFAELASGTAGVIISLPEYNWSFPANLKNIIDWTSRLKHHPLSGKTVLLMSATNGERGGILGLQQIKAPLEHLKMHIFNRAFSLPNADRAFSENGELPDEKHKKLLYEIIKDYHEFTCCFQTNQ